MRKVLYIKANPKTKDESITYMMSEAFLEVYQKENPEDEIITLDLYKEKIDFLSERDVREMMSGQQTRLHPYAAQFAGADLYLIASPFWNLSIPAILKAYFDYVSLAGVTFAYTESGSVGLLAGQNKKAYIFMARGGKYTESPFSAYELGEKYIRTILGFFGITDITSVVCEETAVLKDEALKDNIRQAVDRAKALASISPQAKEDDEYFKKLLYF